MQFLVVLCLLVLIVFGVSSAMGSYATAQQARATAEVAEAAKVSALGNLVVIMLLALLIATVLAVVVWMVLKYSKSNGQRTAMSRQRAIVPPSDTPPIAPPPSIEMLIQLKTLEVLDRMTSPRIEDRNSERETVRTR